MTIPLAAAWPPVPLDLSVLDNATSYISLPPIVTSAAWCAVFVVGTFVLGTITGNYSQVDRIWSFTPWIYVWNFTLVAVFRGYGWDLRLLAMSLLATIWGLRLTYNFWRKGGYSLKEEDYRWPVLRTIITNKFLWHIFSLLFISFYQNFILLAITFPAHVAFAALETSKLDPKSSFSAWNEIDTAAAVGFALLLLLETIADQQMWNFQEKKWAMIKAGKKLEELPAPYKYGFITTGLFKYSRHPNFFAEFSQWWAFYLFSVGASGAWQNWSAIGTILLTLLFQGSTPFTEYITAKKYPLFKVYQKYVPALVPLPGGESFEKLLEMDKKKSK
ncbi:hypothetical protein HDV05_001533 [Chytridiales sp. JEL 0842]|nr:hypothetical protein HDV05_001533 [Chytridiales sp. JEL 0842]